MPALNITAQEIVALVPGLDQAVTQTTVDHVLARAKLKAPCLFHNEADADKVAAGRAILVDALARWGRQHVRGVGELQTKTQGAGPFAQTLTVDTRNAERSTVQKWEWDELVGLCGAQAPSGGPRGTFPQPDGYGRHFRTGR